MSLHMRKFVAVQLSSFNSLLLLCERSILAVQAAARRTTEDLLREGADHAARPRRFGLTCPITKTCCLRFAVICRGFLGAVFR